MLDTVKENPIISSRIIEKQHGAVKSTENKVVREQLIHPFLVQKGQEMLAADPKARDCRLQENGDYAKHLLYKQGFNLKRICSRKCISNF